jgi:spermidine synthase
LKNDFRSDALIYGTAVVAGAGLLFQIQPIAGKFLLPSFGGGASVWTTCMFFFQSMLLAGYGYAHLLTKIQAPWRQAMVHASLLVISMLFLPVNIAAQGFAAGAPDPAPLIFLSLLASIGFPFVMLASTAPLIQKWSSITRPAHSPYRLYALSNAGALLALLTYPLLVEPNMSLRIQSVAWSLGYGAFVAALLAAAWLVWARHDRAAERLPGDVKEESGASSGTAITSLSAALTVCLSACGVVVLLAVTNEITQNVAPVPFLWILPLVCYLLTYIICFSGEQWYDRAIWGSLFVVSGSGVIILHFFATSFPIVPVVVAYLLVLFCVCIVCHAELYRLRPDDRQLTSWYLLIALGGAIGGAFVSVVAPAVFTRYWETLAGAFLIYIVFGIVVLRDDRDRRRNRTAKSVPALQAALERWALRLFAIGWVAGLFLLPAVVVQLNTLRVEYDIASSRNFYGLLNVRDVTSDGIARRVLVDGTTIHGFQLLEDSARNTPTSYYGASTGIASVMESIERTDAGLRVGIVGLGTGTLAAYGEARDEYRFYELNPAVVDVANRYFSFLRDSRATVDIVPGDGRISMERELRESGSRRYDVLVIDAFNSDAIPVHLLTLEALELYWSHLKPGGVLALHLTNDYLDLVRVAGNVGHRMGKEVLLITTPRAIGVTSAADWVLLLEDSRRIAGSMTGGASTRGLTLPGLERVWTDDYSNLPGALRRKLK